MAQEQGEKVDLRFRYVGMVAALVGTVVGGLIAGGFTVWATHSQLQSQADESRAEFFRDQRQTAYAELMTQMDAAYYAQTSELEALKAAHGAAVSWTQTDVNGAYARLAKAVEAYEHAWSVVQLIGSPAVLEVAEDLEVSLSTARDAFAGSDRSGTGGNERAIADLSKAIDRQPLQWIHFLRAARADLEIDNGSG